MILKASQRGGDAALAAHLTNADDNDHIEVHAINGFISNDVAGAFQEIRAAAQATNCKQYLFSLSLSPPEEANVSNADFEVAIAQAMKRLGLADQPHVVIFHEKHARRHAHLVVSRIDAGSMTAINLSFFKDRLCDLSRELFLQHGWELPQGHVDRKLSDPLNYSLEEYQVAKRAKRDPLELKAALKECWAQSDNKASFEAALKEYDFQLCRGDRRGFVAIDKDGKVYSLSRWLNVKPKLLKLRLGDPELLLSVEEALSRFNSENAPRNDDVSPFSEFKAVSAKPDPLIIHLDQKIADLESAKSDLIQSHRKARVDLRGQQQKQRKEEIETFKRSHSPLRRLWQWAVGNRKKLLRERQEALQVVEDQFTAERQYQSEEQRLELRKLRSQIAELKRQRNSIQPLVYPPVAKDEFKRLPDPDFAFHKSQIERSPDYVLRLLCETHAEFSRNDILRKLSEYICGPEQLRCAVDSALASSELILVNGKAETDPRFTTRSFQQQDRQLMDTASFLSSNKAYGVERKHMQAAVNSQNKQLQKTAGVNLSDEQCAAIEHVLNRRQIACVVGLAGAGKSTMLNAARDAWERQGYRVIGGALAGKAADSLQSSSGIASRTLHSWEHGWKNGNNHLKAGDILVIDEAGMVGTAQLARIAKHVRAHKAKLVLVGDPEQLQPIQAGTPFKDIAGKTGFVELTEIRRQKSVWQKAATLDLAHGETEKAIKSYEDQGKVEHAQSEHDAISALVEDYMIDWELHGEGKSRMALAHRRQDVFAINKAIRSARHSAGELENERVFDTDFGKRVFAKGDRVLITRNDYDLNVKNGMLGWVTEIDGDKFTVQLHNAENTKSPRSVTFDTKRFSSFDHGYATTVHKSQGATVDHAFVLKSRTMDKHLSYVAMTRHKQDLRIYDHSSGPRSGHGPDNKASSIYERELEH
ncbi:Ti-type conjugative transfer relaxase TraA [Roseibium sp. TrichSKD4]|uniref:AAA family ATPase n=1 Tax=Roseibium sp. TrichSKD4 TaxID=744980 RepID=UPI0001E562BC|nr:AAA family ATPase [Roseibium sp. TrichSKD4]EFO32990.1 Ti-type conjugative transfer relaxase TraA [Roseibium sp. TrichSKD4]